MMTVRTLRLQKMDTIECPNCRLMTPINVIKILQNILEKIATTGKGYKNKVVITCAFCKTRIGLRPLELNTVCVFEGG